MDRINFKLVSDVALVLYLGGVATVYLLEWSVSPKFLGWTALVAAVALILSHLVAGSLNSLKLRRKQPEQPQA